MKSSFIKGSVSILMVCVLVFESSCAAFKKQRCDMCPEFTQVDKEDNSQLTSQFTKIENEKNAEIFN